MYVLSQQVNQADEPSWRHWRRLDQRLPDASVRGYLFDQGSLTQRLIAASGNRFRVRVLGQGWRRPRLSERQALRMRPAAIALVREVVLECAGEPWVFARSILPASSLTRRLRHLRRFGHRSLGALLFADPRLRREPFEIARIGGQHGILPDGLAGAHPLWGRRSVFHLHGQTLLVAEIFLPACRLGSDSP